MTRKPLKELYLDKDRAIFAGVCAGLSNYFDCDVRLIRLGFVIGFFFSAPVVIIVYLALAWFLDPAPTVIDIHVEMDGNNDQPQKQNVSHRRRYAKIQTRYQRLEERLRALESVVTSRAFQMDRELRKS